MVANKKPQKRKNEESEMLRVGRDQIEFIDLRFASCKIQERKKKARRSISCMF